MENIKEKLISGEVIPFIGMGVFKDTVTKDGGTLPFDSDSMVLALNNGRAMSSRLMYEYTRAAMSLEQRKGREFIVQMTNHIYKSKEYDVPYTYEFLKEIQPKYMIDTNLDDSACKVYEDIDHFMITGISRITADYDRFVCYKYDSSTKEYNEINKDELALDLPILFKPMGCMIPSMNFIISDADFVDWLTEAMGGYGLPQILKEYRKDKSYLYLGVDLSRDTYRMVANELTIGSSGGVLVEDKEELTKKENKFIVKNDLTLLNNTTDQFLKDL